ncbi:MAG: T9SS type A sorting domain-containing protein [Candidatus Marinimicrobia bacterium]|nr:T9SS type A sorting domain-containing protein [Candidatus Neomarinimicrobiota bacterium]
MKTMLRTSVVLTLLVFVVFAQAQVINNFDAAPADTNYWEFYNPVTEGGSATATGHYAISTNANPEKGWIDVSYVTDPVLEGSGAMRVDYSAHNSEGWGGYSKLHHFHPDTLSTETYDWSLYDSLSFSYNNIVPQDSLGRVHVRLNLNDYGNVTDSAYADLGEYWYSFNYILDDEPGWNTITIPLTRGDSYGNTDFTYTGWAGATDGNQEVDKDAIKGFAFEFSVSGAGEGDVVTGSIVFDDMKLTGSRNKLTLNPGFEAGPKADDSGVPEGWGGWMAAWDGWGAQTHFATVMSDSAHSGDYYVELGVDVGNGYCVLWPEGDEIPALPSETFEISAWIKDVSPTDAGGDFAALKFEAFDADGNKVLEQEIIQEGVTREWQKFSAQAIMPANTVKVQAVLVATKWLDDGIAAVYAFDDVAMVSLGFPDLEPPAAVENITAIPGTNYNLVTWEEVAGEEGETYTVYASPFPINNINADYVSVVASGILEGAPSVVHYLYTPVVDATANTYYAVVCTDAAANVGPAGYSTSSFANEALGIPTISLNPPANFTPDGFFDEWAGIEPFIIGQPNSWGHSEVNNTVTDNSDASAKLYLAVDQDYLYVAADVVDDVYYGWTPGTGNWWDHDALQLFIGLYDQRGPRHGSFQRGDEPDYSVVFANDSLYNDNPGGMSEMAGSGDGMYYFEGFSSDYVIEAKISLDSLAASGEDAKFVPQNGMRIIMEPILHDNDGSGWEGNVESSPLNTDNAWNNNNEWSQTWVGTGDLVSREDVTLPGVYALRANYPNPFNPSTTISYEIAQQEHVKLTIYNMLGQEVANLVNEVQPAGTYQIQFDASTMASGIYLYTIEAGSFGDTQKMILLK